MTAAVPGLMHLPAMHRMAALAPLGIAALQALAAAILETSRLAVRRTLTEEGKPIAGPLLIVSGWAARIRYFMDGRRQLLSFLLPGELVGMCRHDQPVAVSTIVALTDMEVCPAPSENGLPDLRQIYGMSHALDEAFLLAHIARLGRLSAEDRMIDLLLEIYRRLSMAGLTEDGGFDFPLTQELLADALGLTTVHIGRIVKRARDDRELVWKGRRMTLTDPGKLAEKIDSRFPNVGSAIWS